MRGWQVSGWPSIRSVVVAGMLLFGSGTPALAQTHAGHDEQAHTVHDEVVSYYVLLDEFEWQGSELGGLHWDNKGWVGRDLDRLWFRSELSTDDGTVDDAEMHVMYGRAFSRWWEVVGGVRQDFRPGPTQTWAAFGIQGLAPYWLEVEITGYVGAGGRTALRLETETDLLITNRLVLQPLIEVNLSGKSDPERGVGSGLKSTETGLRLRYEFRRELAPYIGVTWNRKYGETADFAEQAGEKAGTTRLLVGIRAWF
jgi:copper resistance protein B